MLKSWSRTNRMFEKLVPEGPDVEKLVPEDRMFEKLVPEGPDVEKLVPDEPDV